MADVVYRSAHLLVKVAHRGGDVCVITFDAFTDTSDLERPAFGERFFQDNGVSAVHIVNGRNRWYHEPDWRDAIDAAWQAVRDYPRRLTYGSSMGGYAALVFAGHLGAQTALALSPQYSRDPRKVPFERRWAPHRRERWLAELSGPLPRDVAAIAVYDPVVRADRAHVDCIAREMQVSRLALPHAGHGCAAFLADVGLLGPLVLSVVTGTGDLTGISKMARERRKQSPHYLIALCEAALAQKRLHLAKRLAERAIHLVPGEEGPWHVLGRVQDRLGAFPESLSAHQRAANIAPHLPAVQFGLAVAQRRVGDLEGALQTLIALSKQPLPAHSGRFVTRAIWLTRALRWLAPAGAVWMAELARSHARARSQRWSRPLALTDPVKPPVSHPHGSRPSS